MRILTVRATVTPKRSLGDLIRFSLWRASQWLSRLWPFFRRQLRQGKKVSPMILPDEVLLLICDLLGDQGTIDRMQDDIFGKSLFQSKTETPGDLSSLSMVNRRLRSLAVPWLFRTIYIGTGWRASRIYTVVLSLEKALPVLQKYTRTCKVDIYDDTTAGPRQPHRSSLKRLLQLLQRLDRLEKITLHEPMLNPSGWQIEGQIALPQVKSLVLSPGAAWFIRHCPNVASIATNDWQANDARREIMYAHAASATKLEFFCESRGSWNSRLLQKLHENVPQLRQLCIVVDNHLPTYMTLQDITAALREFKHLRHLALSARLCLLVRIWLDRAESASTNYSNPCTFDPRIGETIRHKIDGHYVEEETVRATAGSILHALPQLETVFVGRLHQVRVLQRTEHDETILAEIETRSVWTEWPRVTMVSAARPQAYIETCTLRDYSRLRDRVDVLSMDRVIEHELREMALETMTLHGGD